MCVCGMCVYVCVPPLSHFIHKHGKKRNEKKRDMFETFYTEGSWEEENRGWDWEYNGRKIIMWFECQTQSIIITKLPRRASLHWGFHFTGFS